MDTANASSSSSSSKHLPWLWVVESLAEFKQVDTALLYDLMSRVPESFDESWSRNARERLALRHLEDLLGGTSVSADATNLHLNSESHVEFGIHSSERAEDVLSRLLEKMATSSLSISTLECFKRDVHQFILQKREGLPKCTLQQLKDLILEGGHPYATVLREKSGLDRQYQDKNRIPEDNGDPNEATVLREKSGLDRQYQDKNRIPEDNGDPNEAAERLDQNTNKVEIQAPKENLTHLSPENGNELLQEDPCAKGLKSTRRDMAKQNQVRTLDGNRICLDGENPRPSVMDDELNSINEKSSPLGGLDRQYQDNNRIPEDNADPNEAAECLDQNANKVEIQAPKEKLTHLVPENGNKLLQEDPCAKGLKSTRRDMAKQNQVRTLDGNIICLDGVDNAAKNPKQSMKDDELHSINEKLAPLAIENTQKVVQGLPETILISGKRERSGFTVGCLDIDRIFVDSGNNHPDTKKPTNSGDRPMGESSDPLHVNEVLQDSHGRISLSTEREASGLAKATRVHDLQRNGICVDDDFDCVILKRIKRSANDGEIQHDQPFFPSNKGKIPQKTPSDGSPQNNHIHDTRDNSENHNKPETSRGNYENLGKAPDLDSDEEMLIAAEKRSFLISQNTFNQDSQRADWTEQSSCIKCDRGGQLMICCVSSCPIAVHESCVGSSACFDDTGNFYCPFCSFSQATAAYHETKKKAALIKEKAALRRKHLFKFMRMVHVRLQKQPSEIIPTEGPRQSTMVSDAEFLNETDGTKHQRERNHSQPVCIGVHQEEAGIAGECIDGDALDRGAATRSISERNNVALTGKEHHQKQVNNHQDRRIEDQEPLEPSSVHLGDGLSPAKKEITVVCKKTQYVSLSKERGKTKIDKGHQFKMGGEEKRQVGVRKSKAANSPCTDTRIVLINQDHADIGTENSDLQQQIIDIPQGSSESENDNGISFEFRRRQKPAKSSSNRAFPRVRRKKVPWTAEEEEILKKGVRKFSSADEKWKKILEFGRHTFQESRTTIDLKDKWRNMTKFSPRTR